MKVTDEMVEAACEAYWYLHWNGFLTDRPKSRIRIAMRRAIEAALKVKAMEQLIEAGAEQMEQEDMR